MSLDNKHKINYIMMSLEAGNNKWLRHDFLSMNDRVVLETVLANCRLITYEQGYDIIWKIVAEGACTDCELCRK